MMCSLRALGGVLAVLLLAQPATALELSVDEPEPTVVGSITALSAALSDVDGTAEIRWTFGDGERTEFAEGATSLNHTYTSPGHYSVIVVARDDSSFQSFSFVHTVHNPSTQQEPQSALPLVYEPTRGTVITANTDNNTITFVDAESLEKVAEIPVHKGPVAVALAPDGKIWVVHRDDFSIAIIDSNSLEIVETLKLPYASQPMGVVFSAEGDAFLPLMALGEVIRLDSNNEGDR